MTEDWVVANDFHHAAHDYAHKEATKAANKLKKVIRRLWGFDNKVVVEAQYKSAYEQFYRDQLLREIIGFIRSELKRSGERPAKGLVHDLAVDASRDHLHTLFNINPEAQQ
jgi:hypothetical protein